MGLPAAAQGGGFVADDLYAYTSFTTSPFNGIVRVNPVTAVSSVHATTTSIVEPDAIDFDAYRQRLVYLVLEPGLASKSLIAVDGLGAKTTLRTGLAWESIAATGDGRIYFHDFSDAFFPKPYRYLDAANQTHILYAADGVTPFKDPTLANGFHDMLYHAGENALFLSSQFSSPACAGGPLSVYVHKLPLSADGTRVVGPLACGSFDVHPLYGSVPVSLTPLPNGDLLLGANNGDTAVNSTRLMRVDPVSLAITPFASFQTANDGSVYSHALGKGIAYSHFAQKLVAYSDGLVGAGTAIPTTMSFNGNTAEIVEVPALGCKGGWIAYGQGLAGKGGVVPRLYGTGCPAPSASVTLHVDQAVGGTGGAIMISVAPASIPLVGGTLLVVPGGPLVNVFPGGAVGVAGAGAAALPVVLPPDPGLSGVSFYLQAGFFDAAAAQSISMSQGLEIELG